MKKDALQETSSKWTLAKANDLIAKQSAEIDALQSTIKTLSARIAKLEERQKTNSKNSSLPPSKDKSSKNKTNAKRNAKRKALGRKRGGQPGHKKHERSLVPQEAVDHTVICLPPTECGCGGRVDCAKTNFRRHQQYEFPVIKPIVTEYQLYTGHCQHCKKSHKGRLPLGVSWSMLGPRATAMTAHLSGSYRLSKKNIVNIYSDLFNFTCSTGMVCKAEQTVSQALQGPVSAAHDFIKHAKHQGVNADETGFKQQGKGHWAWLATHQNVAVFLIRKNRSKKVAKELLGTEFNGILCSDRYNAYNFVDKEQRQYCWAHLDRDFCKMAGRSGVSKIIGNALMTLTDTLFHHWHLFIDGKISRRQLRARIRRLREKILVQLRRGKRARNSATAGTCRTLLKYEKSLWLFAKIDGIEPTNNLAERLIRTLVIWKKTSFGTQSKKGSTYMERIMSVVATCKLQHRNILEYLTQAVQCFVEKTKPPSLLPEIKENEQALIAA